MMRMMKIMHSLRLILLETIKKKEMKIGYGNVFKLKIKKYINISLLINLISSINND